MASLRLSLPKHPVLAFVEYLMVLHYRVSSMIHEMRTALLVSEGGFFLLVSLSSLLDTIDALEGVNPPTVDGGWWLVTG